MFQNLARKKPEAFVSSFHLDYAEYNLNYQKPNEVIKPVVKNVEISKPTNNFNLIDLGFSSNNQNKNVNNQVSNTDDKNKGLEDIFDIINKNK